MLFDIYIYSLTDVCVSVFIYICMYISTYVYLYMIPCVFYELSKEGKKISKTTNIYSFDSAHRSSSDERKRRTNRIYRVKCRKL